MNAIVYLVRASNHDLKLLEISINILKRNFINLEKCDIIIFHEKELIPALPFVKSLSNRIITQNIEFTLPDYYKDKKIPERYPHPFVPGMSFSLGYRHMCRFFSGEIFNQDVLKKYKKILRLDNDSFIHKIEFDFFDFVDNNNILYGYIEQGVQYDDPGVTKGLWCLSKKIKPHNIEENKMYYTNFEMMDIDWFKSSEYNKFYKIIDENGGIMTNRWGDAPIRYLGVNMFMNAENIFGFNDIVYQHGSFISHKNTI